MLLELDIGTWPKLTPTYTATSPLWRSYESEEEGGDLHLPPSQQALPLDPLSDIGTHQKPEQPTVPASVPVDHPEESHNEQKKNESETLGIWRGVLLD